MDDFVDDFKNLVSVVKREARPFGNDDLEILQEMTVHIQEYNERVLRCYQANQVGFRQISQQINQLNGQAEALFRQQLDDRLRSNN